MKVFSVALPRLATACACSLFLVSILFPFLTVHYHTIIPEVKYNVTYWSHKATITNTGLWGYGTSETLFFNDYWFTLGRLYYPPSPSDFEISWVLVAMFFAQILTLGFGFTALFKRERMIQFLPLISCLSVTFIMTLTTARVHGQILDLANYGLGYWLTYPSTILFLYPTFKSPNNLENQTEKKNSA